MVWTFAALPRRVLLKRSEYLYQTALKTLRRQHRAAHPGAAEAAGARPTHQITYLVILVVILAGNAAAAKPANAMAEQEMHHHPFTVMVMTSDWTGG